MTVLNHLPFDVNRDAVASAGLSYLPATGSSDHKPGDFESQDFIVPRVVDGVAEEHLSELSKAMHASLPQPIIQIDGVNEADLHYFR
jgi:hypothetical protein